MFDFFHRRDKNAKLFYTTDVHCHIAPGVDHGSQNVQQSLDMLRAEADMGVTRVILTSHTTAETFENTPATLKASYETLVEACRDAGIGIELHVSSEYRIDEYYSKLYGDGQILPMPGNYLLLENSFVQELLSIDDMMFDVQCKGYHPILAHPERYRYYHDNHSRYEKLHGAGVLFQVNILSLAGYFGSGTRDAALWLIGHNMADMFGSDMHNIDHAHVIKDYIGSKEWRKIAEKVQGRIVNDMVR